MFTRENHYKSVWDQEKWRCVTLKVVNFEKNDDEDYLGLEKCRMTHRDIKPSNVMIDANGEVTLVCFGIGNQGHFLESYEHPGFFASEQ